jgi:3-oxoacyl-[acyl-carrier protein] reductase
VIDLTGRRAFVTGGGRGIGRATALLLAQAGARIAIGYRSRRADAEETIRAIGGAPGRAEAVGGDLGDPAVAAQVMERVVTALGGLDLLVVNHGVWPSADIPLSGMSAAQWEDTRRANLDSVFFVCRAAIPPGPGGIVPVASRRGRGGLPRGLRRHEGAVIATRPAVEPPPITVVRRPG